MYNMSYKHDTSPKCCAVTRALLLMMQFVRTFLKSLATSLLGTQGHFQRWIYLIRISKYVAGGRLLLNIYTASSDELRYEKYKNKNIWPKKALIVELGLTLNPFLQIQMLPNISYCEFFHVQKWLENSIPTDWGWITDLQSGHLVPIGKDQAAAPDKVVKMIICGCKQGCK